MQKNSPALMSRAETTACKPSSSSTTLQLALSFDRCSSQSGMSSSRKRTVFSSMSSMAYRPSTLVMATPDADADAAYKGPSFGVVLVFGGTPPIQKSRAYDTLGSGWGGRTVWCLHRRVLTISTSPWWQSIQSCGGSSSSSSLLFSPSMPSLLSFSVAVSLVSFSFSFSFLSVLLFLFSFSSSSRFHWRRSIGVGRSSHRLVPDN
mmetsp:Transcript_31506/g.74142  ORF Transcript_31506/g.74142 Transcript_31506/m.74142 type:complete len:205 (+) Transcript_31506:199-813(+)